MPSELANQRARKALFTCVGLAKNYHIQRYGPGMVHHHVDRLAAQQQPQQHLVHPLCCHFPVNGTVNNISDDDVIDAKTLEIGLLLNETATRRRNLTPACLSMKRPFSQTHQPKVNDVVFLGILQIGVQDDVTVTRIEYPVVFL